MIDLHYWPTPNGKKVTILLEECGLPYRIVPVNIGRGDLVAQMKEVRLAAWRYDDFSDTTYLQLSETPVDTTSETPVETPVDETEPTPADPVDPPAEDDGDP